ncbi:MAG: hypothetical protein WCK35_18515, partial [Chloroflexota bacterium]
QNNALLCALSNFARKRTFQFLHGGHSTLLARVARAAGRVYKITHFFAPLATLREKELSGFYTAGRAPFSR